MERMDVLWSLDYLHSYLIFPVTILCICFIQTSLKYPVYGMLYPLAFWCSLSQYPAYLSFILVGIMCGFSILTNLHLVRTSISRLLLAKASLGLAIACTLLGFSVNLLEYFDIVPFLVTHNFWHVRCVLELLDFLILIEAVHHE